MSLSAHQSARMKNDEWLTPPVVWEAAMKTERMSIEGRLFQARMWREYAMAWDGRRTASGVGREWVEQILRVPRAECLRRARMNVHLARRLNRLRAAKECAACVTPTVCKRDGRCIRAGADLSANDQQKGGA